jgi:hypothetical protein
MSYTAPFSKQESTTQSMFHHPFSHSAATIASDAVYSLVIIIAIFVTCGWLPANLLIIVQTAGSVVSVDEKTFAIVMTVACVLTRSYLMITTARPENT